MKKYIGYTLYLALVLLVMLPLYRPGFVFLLDFVPTPDLQLSDYLKNGVRPEFPLVIIQYFLSSFLPYEIIQKMILSLVLILPGVFMFKLSKRYLSTPWATVSGVFYMINPYVYERFLAGHWYVLLGYAYFPFIVGLFLRLLKSSDIRDLLKFSLAFSIYPILSQHWAYISFWFLAVLAFCYVIFRRQTKNLQLSALFKKFLIFTSIFLLINSFWLFSLNNGQNPVDRITPDDLRVYSTMSDYYFGVYFNALSLYGFWQVNFWQPKQFFEYWWVFTLIVMSLSIVGGYILVRKKDLLGITILITFIPFLILAVGFGDSFSRGIVEFLYYYLPGFKGLRETAKLVGVLAFCYALLFPIGAKFITESLVKNSFPMIEKFLPKAILGIVFSIPLLMTNTIFWGFRGQIEPSYYPQSWYKVNEITKNDGKILFLPWWGYLNLPFAGLRTIANPATSFFEADILQGQSINNDSKIEQFTELDKRVIGLRDGTKFLDDNLYYFKSEGISYIILAKLQDYQKYTFLQNQTNLKKEFESEEIVLYSISN